MLRVGDEYTDLATTSAPKPIDLACGRHPGHLSDAAEDATSDSYFKAVATCGDGGGSELRRSSRCREPFRLRAQARIVLKELNETAVWLQLILKGSLMTPEKMSAVVAENEELCKIIAGSIKTAGGFDRT